MPTEQPAPNRSLVRLRLAMIFITAGFLILYAPFETLYSWGHLSSPGYICDVIAFVLLAYGCVRAWQQRPHYALGPMCAAWGYCLALFWRCYFMRRYSEAQDLGIYPNEPPIIKILLLLMMLLSGAMLLCLLILDRRQPFARR